MRVIVLAVRWYLRYGLSYRDVEELLAERGVTVDHVTIYRWVQRFTPLLIDAAQPCRHAPGDRWFVDETYVKIAGRWVYLYRAIDQSGQVIDVLVSEKRDLAATHRFFTRALTSTTLTPVEVITVNDHVIPPGFAQMITRFPLGTTAVAAAGNRGTTASSRITVDGRDEVTRGLCRASAVSHRSTLGPLLTSGR